MATYNLNNSKGHNVQQAVTIASGAAVSDNVKNGGVLLGWITPGTLTNTAFTVQYSNDDGTTWYDCSGNTTVASSTSTFVQCDQKYAQSLNNIRLKGSQNEGGARSITLVFEG